MLEGLRVASQNWIGRTIMGLVMGVIVISFAIWGIGDVFRGFSSQRLVKIGGGEVSVEAFRSSYQNELRACNKNCGAASPTKRPVAPASINRFWIV